MGYTGSKSPNRLDAFVFAIAELFPSITRRKKPEREPITVPNTNRVFS
jgi:phage terminase large subunit-like protein